MAAFRFSLQPVLERRTRIETAQREVLLAAERAAAGARAELVALDLRLHGLSRAFSGSFAALGASDVRGLLLEIEVVKTSLAKQRHVTDAARAAASRARDAFGAARAERTTLEAVRDRCYAAFLAEQELRETAEYDESNARRRIISA